MIAYFLLVHRYPEQFKRLFKAIYSPDNEYLIHVDKRAGVILMRELKLFLADYANVSVMNSQNIVWGGYSMVDAEIRGMKLLLKQSLKWDHYINLSGQDFPLKSQSFIQSYLKQFKDKDFMLTSDQVSKRFNTLNRIDNYFVESENGFIGTPFKRRYLKDVTPYIGGQWKILSRKTVEFIATDKQVTKFKEFYKNTLIPDEGFFQTLLMNTGLSGNIINDDKRAIIWIPDIALKIQKGVNTKKDTQSQIDSGKIKLRPKIFSVKDTKFLLASEAFFARKFDETVDSQIIDQLEFNLEDMEPRIKIKKSVSEIAEKTLLRPLVPALLHPVSS